MKARLENREKEETEKNREKEEIRRKRERRTIILKMTLFLHSQNLQNLLK